MFSMPVTCNRLFDDEGKPFLLRWEQMNIWFPMTAAVRRSLSIVPHSSDSLEATQGCEEDGAGEMAMDGCAGRACVRLSRRALLMLKQDAIEDAKHDYMAYLCVVANALDAT